MKSGDPVYRYGKAQYQGAEYDPSALGGDLGNNAVKAGKYGISNLKYILGNMTNGWNNKIRTTVSVFRSIRR